VYYAPSTPNLAKNENELLDENLKFSVLDIKFMGSITVVDIFCDSVE